MILNNRLELRLVNTPDLLPIFPLPVVLFPHQILPLHIFEPAYRTMTEDALSGERLFAVALLKPGYEAACAADLAPIHRLMGVGRIISAERLQKGRFNLILRGEGRARLVREFPGRPYRFGLVEWQPSRAPAVSGGWRDALRGALRSTAVLESDLRERLLQLFGLSIALGDLTDLVCGALPFHPEWRQRLLAACDVEERLGILLDQLHSRPSPSRFCARPLNLN